MIERAIAAAPTVYRTLYVYNGDVSAVSEPLHPCRNRKQSYCRCIFVCVGHVTVQCFPPQFVVLLITARTHIPYHSGAQCKFWRRAFLHERARTSSFTHARAPLTAASAVHNTPTPIHTQACTHKYTNHTSRHLPREGRADYSVKQLLVKISRRANWECDEHQMLARRNARTCTKQQQCVCRA